jgi:hypothetical protein
LFELLDDEVKAEATGGFQYVGCDSAGFIRFALID